MNNNIEFTCDIFIKASPKTVFGFLTEGEKVAQWFGEIVEIEGRNGGRFYVAASSGLHAAGKFTEVVPHEKVEFTWGGHDGIAAGATNVAVTLKPEDGGTRLSLRHYNIPTQEAADSYGEGWPKHALPLLKLVAEGGKTEERCFRAAGGCEAAKSSAA